MLRNVTHSRLFAVGSSLSAPYVHCLSGFIVLPQNRLINTKKKLSVVTQFSPTQRMLIACGLFVFLSY